MPDIVKLPPTLNKPEFIENEVMFAATIANVDVTLVKAGRVKDVRVAQVRETAPLTTERFVKVTDVAPANVSVNAPVTVTKLAIEKEVKAARVPVNAPLTVVKADTVK